MTIAVLVFVISSSLAEEENSLDLERSVSQIRMYDRIALSKYWNKESKEFLTLACNEKHVTQPELCYLIETVKDNETGDLAIHISYISDPNEGKKEDKEVQEEQE